MLNRILEPFTDLGRWGEPYDVEDDDPLLDGPGRSDESFNLWG